MHPQRIVRTVVLQGAKPHARAPDPPSAVSCRVRILLIRDGGLGDILLTRPAVRALRRRYPAAHLIAAGPAARWRLVPGVDEILDLDLVAPDALAVRTWDLDLTIAWSVHPPPHLPPPDIHLSPYPPPGIHAADWLVRSLGEHGLPLPADRRPDRHHPGSAVYLHPGAGAAWKRWPAARFASLARKVPGAHLLAGPADASAAAAVLRDVSLPVLRPTTLRALADRLREARLFIGNDSGVTHLAAALGVPTVALFGPTDPAQWAPLGEVLVLRRCLSRASRQGQVRVCDDPACLDALTVADVLAAIGEMDAGRVADIPATDRSAASVDKDVDGALREPRG